MTTRSDPEISSNLLSDTVRASSSFSGLDRPFLASDFESRMTHAFSELR